VLSVTESRTPLAGVVDAVGEEAGAAVGDEVLGVASVGGYSEFALLDRPVAKAEGLSWEDAAARGITVVGTAAQADIARLTTTTSPTTASGSPARTQPTARPRRCRNWPH
jgi:hypothetical protein